MKVAPRWSIITKTSMDYLDFDIKLRILKVQLFDLHSGVSLRTYIVLVKRWIYQTFCVGFWSKMYASGGLN